MSPRQASFFIPMLVLCIYFASYYINIRMAKKRVSIWKRHSTFMFLRSTSLAGIKTRANLVWMQKLGYDESDAIILAEYQTRANVCAFVGLFIFGPIAVSFVQR